MTRVERPILCFNMGGGNGRHCIRISLGYTSTNKLLAVPDISILCNMMKPQDNYCQRLIPQNYIDTVKHGIPQGGLAVIATFIFWSTARRVANAHHTSQYYRAKSEVLLHRSQSWISFDI